MCMLPYQWRSSVFPQNGTKICSILSLLPSLSCKSGKCFLRNLQGTWIVRNTNTLTGGKECRGRNVSPGVTRLAYVPTHRRSLLWKTAVRMSCARQMSTFTVSAYVSTLFWCHSVWPPSSQLLSQSSRVYSLKEVIAFVQAKSAGGDWELLPPWSYFTLVYGAL